MTYYSTGKIIRGRYRRPHRLLRLVSWAGDPRNLRRARCIRIDANGNVHVARVRVTITDERGTTLELGEARRTFGKAWWEFETRTKGNILVEVWDLAGNLARQEA